MLTKQFDVLLAQLSTYEEFQCTDLDYLYNLTSWRMSLAHICIMLIIMSERL